MNAFEVDVINPGWCYAIFYSLAFLVGFVLLTMEGRRRKLPMVSWWLVIATAFFFFMVGSQVIRWGDSEWGQALRLEPLTKWPGRSVLGGILFFVPGLLLAKHALRFKHSVVDAFALAFPVGLAIQRVGCFLAGCCFGTPTEAPWGVKYGVHAEALFMHVQGNLVPDHSAWSLPVHPVQLYDLMCCMAIFLVIHFLKRRLKVEGNLLVMSLSLYGVCRFFLEFVRADNSTFKWFHLNTVQLGLLVTLPFAVWLMCHRERNSISRVVDQKSVTGLHQVVYGSSLIFLVVMVSRWMSLLEIVSLQIVFIPLTGMVVVRAFNELTIPSLRTATLCLIVASMCLLSQTYPDYANKSKKYVTLSYGSLGGNTNTGFFKEQGYCGPYFTNSYNNEYSAKAIGISYTQHTTENESMTFGLNGVWGSHNENILINGLYRNNSNSIGAVNPYFRRDWKNLGLGVGFHLGTMTQLHSVDAFAKTSVSPIDFAPSLSLRYGEVKDGFVEYRLFNQFPTPFPAQTHQLSFAIKMGKHGGVFRLGTASNAAFFLAPSITFGEHFILEPYFGLGGSLLSSSSGTVSSGIFSISAHARF